MLIDNAFISNSRFRFTDHPGTGNKSCKVSSDEKLRLSNVLIDRAGVDEFLKVLYGTGEKKMNVELSSRRTSNRWGTAWSLSRRVKIYRHTVWVFLHELAHILDVKKEYTGYTLGRNHYYAVAARKPHGPDFGRHLAYLYKLWMEFCDRGVENKPEKWDKPNLDHDYITMAEQGIPETVKFDPDVFAKIRKNAEKKNQWKVPPRRSRVVGGISLQVGDIVWFKARGNKIYATVKRVNKKTCRVSPLNGSRDWRVSPKLLNKK